MTTDNPAPDTARRKRMLTILGVGTVVVAVLVAAGLWWFFRDDAPEAVNLDAAVSAAEGDGAVGPEAAGDVDGSWAVDTTIGTFDFETASGSFVGFRIEEELSTIGSTTAVGRTGDVQGSLVIDGGRLVSTSISADMTTITTNDSRRDSRARGAVRAGEFPSATFVLTQPLDLGAAASDGSPVSVTAIGDLTIAGVTNEVEFAIDAQLTGDVIAVVGSTEIDFVDFDVEVPAAPIILSVDDHGVVEFQLLFSRS